MHSVSVVKNICCFTFLNFIYYLFIYNKSTQMTLF